jgi:hypothetical protein
MNGGFGRIPLAICLARDNVIGAIFLVAGNTVIGDPTLVIWITFSLGDGKLLVVLSKPSAANDWNVILNVFLPALNVQRNEDGQNKTPLGGVDHQLG